VTAIPSGCGKTQPDVVSEWDVHRRAVVAFFSRQSLESHDQDGQQNHQMMRERLDKKMQQQARSARKAMSGRIKT